MTTPDPVPFAAPAELAMEPPPVDSASGEPPRKLFSVAFWIVIGFGALCIVAGLGVAVLGPKLFPARPAVSAPAAAAGPTVDQRLADIQARLSASPPSRGAVAADIAALSARVDRLEADRRRMAHAAAAALSAAALSDAGAGSRPFTAALAAAEPALSGDADLPGLLPLAKTGAPTLAVLAAEYPQAAARAAVAARAGTGGRDWTARIAQAFAAIVTVRRVDAAAGTGVDAVLARAGARLDDGDLAAALSELNLLPAPAREAMADWRTRAQRRAEIDRRLDRIREAALADLVRISRAPAGGPRP